MADLYKVVATDNYARESVAEYTIADSLAHGEAVALCNSLCESLTRPDDKWYVVCPQNYVLWRGMEELI